MYCFLFIYNQKHTLLTTNQYLQLDESVRVKDPDVLFSVRVYKPYGGKKDKTKGVSKYNLT